MVASSATSSVTTSAGAGDQTAYVDALRSISTGLVAKPDRAVSRGQNVCLDLGQGKDRAVVVDNARQRFSGEVTLDAEQAAKIVAAAEANLCR